MKKKKAICYYRVSSEQQAKKQSINMQKLRLKEFAGEKGYEIVAEFEDDGISGESIKSRPGFQETLATIAQGVCSVPIVVGNWARIIPTIKRVNPTAFATAAGERILKDQQVVSLKMCWHRCWTKHFGLPLLNGWKTPTHWKNSF